MRITKGALRQILSVCTQVERSDGSLAEVPSALPEIERHWRECSASHIENLAAVSASHVKTKTA